MKIYGRNIEYRKTGQPNSKSTSEETRRELLLGRSFYRRYNHITLFSIRFRKFIMALVSKIRNGSA